MGEDGARKRHSAPQVQSKRVIPILIARLEKFLRRRTSGICDADIDSVEYAMNVINEAVYIRAVAYIDGFSVYFDGVSLANGCSTVFECLWVSGAERDVGAFGGECKSSCAAQPVACSGNNCNAIA